MLLKSVDEKVGGGSHYKTKKCVYERGTRDQIARKIQLIIAQKIQLSWYCQIMFIYSEILTWKRSGTDLGQIWAR